MINPHVHCSIIYSRRHGNKLSVYEWINYDIYLFVNINICDTYKFDIFIYEYYPAIKRKFLK